MNRPHRGGGARVSRRWWDQKGIDWKTAKERATETDSESESEMESEVEVEEPEVRREEDIGTCIEVNRSIGTEWSGASVDPWK